MGNWQEVVNEQLSLLREQDLRDVLVTFVGEDWNWFDVTSRQSGVRAYLVQQDSNISHYETFAMLLIERLAKESDSPILYFHTKGVSAPGHDGKRRWRKLMEDHVIRKWRENLAPLVDHDVVGVNWLECPTPHFSGNFWMARADWIRKLPDFVAYHSSRQFVRTNCEFWIGSAHGCRVHSLVYRNQPFWEEPWRWS